MDDTEILYAIKDIVRSPRTLLGYNAADDLIRIRKVISGIIYERIITDPDVVDNVVAYEIEYGGWSVV